MTSHCTCSDPVADLGKLCELVDERVPHAWDLSHGTTSHGTHTWTLSHHSREKCAVAWRCGVPMETVLAMIQDVIRQPPGEDES